MIRFNYSEASNFLSIGATPIKFMLNDAPTTLIKGTNGAGKTTSLDCICYALFNKPLRKVKLGQLVNSVNKKKMLTKVNFDVNGVNYEVHRGQKPTVFKIFANNEQLHEDAAAADLQAKLENDILKCDHKTFTQVVVMASVGYSNFMELNAGDRRSVVESMLDIEIIGEMSNLMKERVKEVKSKEIIIDNKLSEALTHVQAKQNIIDSITVISDDQITQAQYELDNLELSLEKLNEEYNALGDLVLPPEPELPSKPDLPEAPVLPLEPVCGVPPVMPPEPEEIVCVLPTEPNKPNLVIIQEKINESLSKKQTVIDDANRAKVDASFYQDNTCCDRCHQVITEDFKLGILNETNEKLNKLRELYKEIDLELSGLKQELDKGNQELSEYNQWEVECMKISSDIRLQNSNNRNAWLQECKSLNDEYENNKYKLMSEWKSECKNLQDNHKLRTDALISEFNKEIDSINNKYNNTCNDIKYEYNNKKSVLDSSILNTKNQINSTATQIESLRAKQDNSAELHQKELNELKTAYSAFKDEQLNIKEELELCALGTEMLKDSGLKSKIIQQYLPTINQSINDFLDKMGANYSFVLDESFNETIKSRYRDSYSYGSFSNGERSRINFAIMLMWQQLAKSKNTVSSNLLFIDEILDGSLDNEGIHAIMGIFETMNDSNIFVVSHRKEIESYFDAVVEVNKIGNFSNYKFGE